VKKVLHSGSFERDHNADIWEWVDVTPNANQLEILRSASEAKDVVLRFHGTQYRRDVQMGQSDRQALKEVLTAFEALN